MSADEIIVSFDPKSVRSQKRIAYFVATAAYGVLRTASKMRVENIEAMPKGTGAIIAAYHANHLDPILVGLALYRNGYMPHFLAKATLFKGVLGTVLKSIGQIPVLRASAQAGDSLEYAKDALAKGEVVVIYPEGTLTKDPDLWPQHFKSGTARLALETGAPIVPVAHWGLEEINPRTAKGFRFKPVSHTSVVRFGDAIDYRDLLDASAGAGAEKGAEKTAMKQLTRRTVNRIAAMVADLSGRALPEKFTTEEVGE